MRLAPVTRMACICAAIGAAIPATALAQASLPNAARPSGTGQSAQVHVAVIALPASANGSAKRQLQNGTSNSQQGTPPPDSAPMKRGE